MKINHSWIGESTVRPMDPMGLEAKNAFSFCCFSIKADLTAIETGMEKAQVRHGGVTGGRLTSPKNPDPSLEYLEDHPS